jgi:hypothetical protein
MRRPKREFETSTLPEILERLERSAGRLQRSIVAVENVASDLRTDLEHGFGDVEAVELVEADYNAIEEAVTRLDPA